MNSSVSLTGNGGEGSGDSDKQSPSVMQFSNLRMQRSMANSLYG